MKQPPGFVRSKSNEPEFKHPVLWNETVVAKAKDKRLAQFLTLSLERAEIIKRLKAKGRDDLSIVIDLLMAMQKPLGTAKRK